MTPSSISLSTASAMTALFFGCVDLGRTVDTEGTLAAKVVAYEGATSLASANLRGPARIRRLSEKTLLLVARVIRPDPTGDRRGDLFIRLSAPHELSPSARFFGDVSEVAITYGELHSRTGATERFAGSGKVRLDFIPGTGAPSFQVALELELRPTSAPGGPRFLRLHGLVVTEGGPPAGNDIGAGLWGDLFDVSVALLHPDYDFRAFAQGPDAQPEWVLAPGEESPPGFGHFDFGYGGGIGTSDLGGGAGGGDTGSVDTGGGVSTGTSASASTFDDDSDGGCQGDKAYQDSSQCGSLRVAPRGLGVLVILTTLWLARRSRRRKRLWR